MPRFLITALLLLAGCSSPPPPFVGEPAEQKVDFDLTGNWDVIRYITAEQDADPDYQDDGAFEVQFQLERLEKTLQWRDKHGRGTLTLVRHPSDGNLAGEQLRWDRPDGSVWWFSLNRVRCGHFDMRDQKGQTYMALCTDGGRCKPLEE